MENSYRPGKLRLVHIYAQVMMTLSRICPQVNHKLRITYVNAINTGFSVENFLIFYVYNIIPYIDKMDFFPIYIVVKKRKSQKVENKILAKALFYEILLDFVRLF